MGDHAIEQCKRTIHEQIDTHRSHTIRQQSVVYIRWRGNRRSRIFWMDDSNGQFYTMGRSRTLSRKPTIHGVSMS
eukprot:7727533-Ditylum_brightwellii.AAC.1